MLLITLTGALIIAAGWSGLQIHELSDRRAEIKKDYSELNNITYGLLSVNAWRDHLSQLINNRIDDFELTTEQEVALRSEVSALLHAVINKADSLVERKQKTLGGKLKKLAIKTFVKEDKLHKQVPAFAETIVDELKKPKNKAKLKFIAQSKLKEFETITYDSTNDLNRIENILSKYKYSDIETFNLQSGVILNSLQHKSYVHTFIVLSVLLLFLILWFLLRKQKTLHTPFYIMSVLLALIVLFVGLTTPMIEIDARIREMNFSLIGEKISFHDQVIFFQSKSIIDVVRILLETGKYDSMIVGILILAFSILFPILKLLATEIYLLSNFKWRNNKVIQYFAFRSGKWGMADVQVVAIFMAYIGFKGILDNQLTALNMQTESIASISTNQTSLQPGFILFVSFVIFGLVLSVILQKITGMQTEKMPVDLHQSTNKEAA